MNEEFEEGLRKLRNLALFSKFACICVAVASLLASVGILVLLNDQWPPDFEYISDLHGLDVLVIGHFLFLLISWVIVGMWIYRAHTNAALTGNFTKEFSPGWAVGWFLVPIANFFMPYKAMKELWQVSIDRNLDDMQTANGLIWAWWLTWLGASISSFGDEFTQLDAVGYGFTLASALLLFQLIGRITDAQPSMSIATTFE